ncbi:MAG: S1-like domain-containing RNA-binding protein [Crocinitomicaceae bacterium]|nr:S1-like domain-containing RNA-binding protein [Crocinitomicaceae bacterium]
MKIGELNKLRINRFTSVGAYLLDEQENDVLLPNKYLTPDLSLDEEIEVFIYRDSEDRIVATTEDPFIQLNSFAYLTVKTVDNIGAFMDWGLEKDLLVPFSEQKNKLQERGEYLIYMGLDPKTNRLFGSAKINKYLSTEVNDLEANQEVDLLVCELTDLGRKVIVNNLYQGLIFNNFITKNIIQGDTIRGYVKEIREDGKMDITLEKLTPERFDEHSEYILQCLHEKGGVLQFSDKSDPNAIRSFFGMSKKSFKKAIGNLYKEKMIVIREKEIELIK